VSEPVVTTHVPPALTAFVRLSNAHAAMQRAFNQELQAAGSITVTDFEVLRRLADAPEGRMRRIDLAHAAGVTPSGMTRLLDGLERGGLVGKHHCTADHRVTYAVITDRGREVLSSTATTHLAGLVALFGERFSDAELADLVDLLGRLPGADDGGSCPAAADALRVEAGSRTGA
jgi:DNA-binding MarR family transcriptional regulator